MATRAARELAGYRGSTATSGNASATSSAALRAGVKRVLAACLSEATPGIVEDLHSKRIGEVLAGRR